MSRITGSQVFVDVCQFLSEPVFATAFLTDTHVEAGANIDADKLVNRHAVHYTQVAGSDVVSETKRVHICRATGTIKAIKVRPDTAPTGGDKQFTVDVKKYSDASGSGTSLLNAVEVVDNTSVDETTQDATLAASPTVAADDVIEVIITASGSTGSQGDGVDVEIFIDENGA